MSDCVFESVYKCVQLTLAAHPAVSIALVCKIIHFLRSNGQRGLYAVSSAFALMDRSFSFSFFLYTAWMFFDPIIYQGATCQDISLVISGAVSDDRRSFIIRPI